MEASKGNSLNRRSLAFSDEDEAAANLSIFRRRNKIIAVVFILLVISLTLFIGALIVQLLRSHNDSSSTRIEIPPIAYYCYFSNAPTCSETIHPIIIDEFITDPNQILAVSLQTAATHIQRLINTSSTDVPNNCSNSFRDGLGRIRESLATIRVNPFVEFMSEEERVEMKKQIVAAEEDVESCLDGGTTGKLVDVQVYLISAADFVGGYASMGRAHVVEGIVFDRSIVSENMFGIYMCGLQLFIVGMFYSLFRIR